MVGLLLTLPVAAYITGTFVASPADLSPERTPVVISDTPSSQPTPSSGTSPKAPKSPDNTKSAKPKKRPTKQRDDGPGRRGNDDDVQVVRPTPNDVGDDDDAGDDDGGDDSDDGGGGGGGDDDD